MSEVAQNGQYPSGPIQSFVILDFEATGLFPEEKLNPLNAPPVPGDSRRDPTLLLANHCRITNPSDAPHIVELCLVSTSRTQIQGGINLMSNYTKMDEDTASGLRENLVSHSVRLPCCVHTRQVKPELSEAMWNEYEKRRTTCDALVYSPKHLKEKNSFAVEWAGVKLFLEQLPKPACIIAHNGIRFDFRLLYAELHRSGLLESNPIPDEVYFLDSYLMFMDLEKSFHDELRAYVTAVDWSILAGRVAQLMEGESSGQAQAMESNEGTSGNGNRDEDEGATVEEDRLLGLRDKERAQQYDTPKKTHPVECQPRSGPRRATRRRLFMELIEDHPLQIIRTSQWSPAKKKRLRPNFFSRVQDGDWSFNSLCAMKYFHEKGNFQLQKMYRELIGRPLEAHYAQNDCEALLQICVAYGEDFLKYVDAKAAKFPF